MKMMTTRSERMTWLGAGCLALALALAAPAASAGPKEDNEAAIAEFNKGDFVTSMALWLKSAEAGYAPAQVWLGDILDKSEEDEDAVKWYLKAAEQGDASGQFGLGLMHAKGEGVKKDLAQAYGYVLKAAEQAHAPAMFALAAAFRTGGLGQAIDAAKADEWQAKLYEAAPNYKPAPVEQPVEVKKKRRK
ncbi:MAG: sel1 repeat family protein [Burkholderiaceae bacterium]|nr:sel1 repeat family protein [Burkholderiaceae bacterium]